MKAYFLLAILLLGAAVAPAVAAGPPATLLPRVFAAWEINGSEQVSNQPSAADSIYAGVLKEYGFVSLHTAAYTRAERKLNIKAIRFKDATGAYGAFSFYKQPAMQTESIGDQASSANERVLFYRGNIVVEATLDRVTAMSAGELRELANELPLPTEQARALPSLPAYLPKTGYVKNTAKYVVGPLALNSIKAPVTPELARFESGAEVVTGQYQFGANTATLTLIGYPTPQIAGERLRAIEAAMPAQEPGSSPQSQGAGTQGASTRVASKRSGPIVAIVTGAIPLQDAKSLLATINFDADVTWSEAVPVGKNDPRSLLGSLVLLTLIVLGVALVAGIAFGGIRILVKRLYPDRIFDRPEDIEIIQLKL
jgi:hypothetical protein